MERGKGGVLNQSELGYPHIYHYCYAKMQNFFFYFASEVTGGRMWYISFSVAVTWEHIQMC